MKILKVVLIIILIVASVLFRNVWRSGAFRTIENKSVGKVRFVEGLPGVEDITIDQSTGIAFLSSDDRWINNKGGSKKGAIYKLDLNDSSLVPVELTAGFDKQDFRPHGISLYSTPVGKKFLYVINHSHSGNVIELFEFRNDSLTHLESISDNLLISPNDIVGVGERSFYFTNDHDTKPTLGRSLKDILMIGSGNVGYYDGSKMSITSISGIHYANGINVSADGGTLYLAATTGKTVSLYSRDIPSGALTFTSEIETGTGVDNIEVDTEGDLWIGCHPQMMKFLFHAKNESKISPSEVIKLEKSTDGSFKQSTIYLNDGSELSASSVGAPYKDKLLIGPVFQRRIIVATLQ